MRFSGAAAATAFALLTAGATLGAQPRLLTVVVYDSLRSTPLADAFISVDGASRTATTDSLGVARIDSLAPRAYTVRAFHPAFDSVGLAGAVRTIQIDTAPVILRLGIPSFATIWKSMCGKSTPPRDSGVVFGTVRSADRSPLPRATVAVNWSDINYDGRAMIKLARWGGEVRADSSGAYLICGVPRGDIVRIVATSGALATTALLLPPSPSGVQRRDLVATSLEEGANARRGFIAGIVRDEGGRPISGARISTEGGREQRSRADGTFLLDSVPAGTRQVEARFVGVQPFWALVDVLPADTARVELQFRKVVTLAAVKVVATSARQRYLNQIDERLQQKRGRYMDSVEVSRFLTLGQAVSMLHSPCVLYIDTVKFTGEDIKTELKFRNPSDMALIESYQGAMVPLEYRPPGRPCPVVLMWTKNWMP